jgi:hypothetical protein
MAALNTRIAALGTRKVAYGLGSDETVAVGSTE